MSDYCNICKDRKECYSLKYSPNGICLECAINNDSWWLSRVIRKDRKRIKEILKEKEKEREEVELEEEIEEIGDKYDDFYSKFENIKRIKEKERHCKFCNKRKTTRFKIHESASHGGKTRTICLSCLGFIVGMDNQAKWGRNPPPRD